MYRFLYLVCFVVMAFAAASVVRPADGETFYVNQQTGADTNPGTKEKPFKTLPRAADRVNEEKGTGPSTVVLSAGIYALDRTARFKPAREYTQANRLTIRAEMLPDDKDWDAAKMPVLISTMPLRPDMFGGQSYGIQVETSHVTIQGLRVLGTPVHEHPTAKAVRRNYPIVREGRTLDDLLVTQCLFLGDREAIPNHVPILASGNGVVVDHCVFHRCKDTVVYWFSSGPAKGCAMRHCLAVGCYGAGVWTWSPGNDFEFHHNVIADSPYAWILTGRGETKYAVTDSVIVGYKELVGTRDGPPQNLKPADHAFLKLGNGVVTQADGKVQVELDQTNRTYLHLVPGTLGADLEAGLFTKNSGK